MTLKTLVTTAGLALALSAWTPNPLTAQIPGTQPPAQPTATPGQSGTNTTTQGTATTQGTTDRNGQTNRNTAVSPSSTADNPKTQSQMSGTTGTSDSNRTVGTSGRREHPHLDLRHNRVRAPR